MSWLSSLIPSAGVNTSTDLYNTGMGQQIQTDISGLSQYNLGGQNLGQFQNLTQAGIANPYAGGYQAGAGQAGQMGMQAGLGQYGAGQGLMAQGQSFAPDVQSLIQMGFDPQQALYARTAQQVRDQQAAQMASSGVGGTPYGAGLQNQAASNFNIDWQNQQLQRAAQGAGAAGQLAGVGAGLQQQGAGLQNLGTAQYLQGAGQPYSTYAGINQGQLGLLNQANAYGVQAAQIPQMQEQDQAQYVQQAQAAQQAMTNAQLVQANQEFQQAQGLGQDIAGLATGGMSFLGGAMGGGMGGGGGGFGGMPFGQGWGGGSYGGGYGGGFNPFYSAGQGFGKMMGWGGGQFGGYQPSAPYNPGYTGYQGQ